MYNESQQYILGDLTMVKKWISKKTATGMMAVCILALAGCSSDDAKNETDKDVVATVGDAKIMKDDLYDTLVKNSGQQALSALIDEKIVELELEKGKMEISKEDIKKELDVFKEEMGGDEAFKSALEQSGITEDDFKKDIEQYLGTRKLMEPLVQITDEDIEAYFEANKAEYDQEEEIDARHILVEDEKLAKKLVKQIKDGGDFEELAKKHSTDEGSATMGGNLGFFPRGKMVPEFEEKAFSMKKGEVSAPVKSDWGYHIIEVLDKKKAKKAKFEDHKDEVKDKVLDEKMQTEYVTWLEEKRESYDIKNELESEKE